MASFSRRGFTGHRHNDALGLIYMNARYYLPGIGRFMGADTLVPEPGNPQSLNRYSYALNNPVKYRDPSGHYATYDNASTCGTVGSGCVEGKNFVEVAYHVYSEYDVYFSEPSSAWNSSEWWVQLATMPDEQQRDVHDMLLNPVQTPNTLGYNTSQPLVSTEHAARVIGTVDTILDVGAVWDDFYPHILLVRGIPGTWVLPGVGQFLNDWSQSYHPVERVVRATIVAGEGLVLG